MKKTILVLVSMSFLVAACSDSNTEKRTDSATETTVVTESASGVTIAPTGEALVTIHGGDDMKFDLTEIIVKEGQTVRLTLNHKGKASKATMGHNFVLLAQGVSINDFSNEAINAKDNDYIPAGKEKDVIVHTKLLGGGESDTIEFTAPAKGTYDFLCSFPGHAAMMRGTFVVE